MILVPIESSYGLPRLLVINSNFGLIAPFLRYGDLFAENCVFFIPLCYSAHPLPMFPLEFPSEVKRQETSHGATLW